MGNRRENAIVGQSGGPTAVINASVCGVVSGCRGCVKTLYGMVNGIEGLLEERLVSLNHLDVDTCAYSTLALTPSAALGSCRLCLPSDLTHPVYNKIFSVLEKYGVGWFFYIGGNDSMDTVGKLSAYARLNSIDISVIGIPKTVDNDLVLTDHTPGFGSCAKYIASVVCDLWCDVSSYSLPSVTVLEVMGRDTGWLGCACGLPKQLLGYGCDLVYIPEMGVSVDGILGDVDNFLSKSNTLLIGVSEGVSGGVSSQSTDPFGHGYISGIGREIEKAVKEKLRCKARSIELNLVQRCAMAGASATDVSESFLAGKYAAKLAKNGSSGKMVTLIRRSEEYGVDLGCADASLVANKTKYVPCDFFSKGQLTDKSKDYLSPLIMGEVSVKYERGLPRYYKLR